MNFDDDITRAKSTQPDPGVMSKLKIPESVASRATGAQLPGTHIGPIVVAQDMGLSIRVDDLSERLKEIESRMHRLAEVEASKEILQLREVSFEQAKNEISKYFEDHHGENIDAADLQEALGIEIELAIKICAELELEDKIKAS